MSLQDTIKELKEEKQELQDKIKELGKEKQELIKDCETKTKRLLSKTSNLEYKLMNKNKEIDELKDLIVEYFRRFTVEM